MIETSKVLLLYMQHPPWASLCDRSIEFIEPSPEIQVVTQLAMVPLLRRSGFGVPDSVWLLAVMGIDSGQLRKREKIWWRKDTVGGFNSFKVPSGND